jgi:glutathione S-transferase
MRYLAREEVVTMPHRVHLFGSRLSPFVEKVARALALKKIAYALVEPRGPLEFARWNPQARKIPVLEVDGERFYDSTFILRQLDQLVASPPLLAGNPAAAAAQRQLEDWADEALYWYGMALRWTEKNGPATAAQIFAKLPVHIRVLASLFGPRQIRATTVAQGLGRLPPEVLLRELAGHLDDLVLILGNQPFFHADQISVADLAIYGQFHMLRSGPTPDAAALLGARPALLEHMRRVEAATGG